MVPSLTLYDVPFAPKWGFHMPPRYANGHISATSDPIHSMFGSRVGFSGTADPMALFSIRTNRPPSWLISNGHWPYLRNGSRSTYIAHIARSSLRQHNFLVLWYTRLTDRRTGDSIALAAKHICCRALKNLKNRLSIQCRRLNELVSLVGRCSWQWHQW